MIDLIDLIKENTFIHNAKLFYLYTFDNHLFVLNIFRIMMNLTKS